MKKMTVMKTSAPLCYADVAEVKCEEFYEDQYKAGSEELFDNTPYDRLKVYLEKHGGLEGVHADVVRAGDTFVYRPGVIRRHGYVPGEQRGQVYAVYAKAHIKGGATRCVILARHEVEIDMVAKHGGNPDGDWENLAKVVALRSLAEALTLPSVVLQSCRTWTAK